MRVFVGNAGILTQIPAYAGQPAFMRVCWEHCIYTFIDLMKITMCFKAARSELYYVVG